jgi:hypothetical protein
MLPVAAPPLPPPPLLLLLLLLPLGPQMRATAAAWTCHQLRPSDRQPLLLQPRPNLGCPLRLLLCGE